jgi:K+-sensing histidine kinase KdpD
MNDRLLKAREAAILLDVPPDDVTDMARKGRIMAQKKGRQWFFRWRDVTALRRHRERGGAA